MLDSISTEKEFLQLDEMRQILNFADFVVAQLEHAQLQIALQTL